MLRTKRLQPYNEGETIFGDEEKGGVKNQKLLAGESNGVQDTGDAAGFVGSI